MADKKSTRRPLRFVPDNRYGSHDLQTGVVVSNQAFTHGMEAISSLGPSTIRDYERANQAFKDFERLTSDVMSIRVFEEERVAQIYSGVNKPSKTLPNLTYIDSTADRLLNYMMDISQEMEKGSKAHDSLAQSFAETEWIKVNIRKGRPTEVDSSDSTVDLIELSEKYYSALTKFTDRFPTLSKTYRTKREGESNKHLPSEGFKTPFRLTAMYHINKIAPALTASLSEISKATANSIDGFSSAIEGLTSWGDIKDNPIGAIVAVMGGQVGLITGGMNVGASFLNASGNVANVFLKLMDKGKGDNLKEDSPATLVTKTVANMGNILLSAFSGGINIISSLITGTMTMFVNLMGTFIKILKTIAETSEMFKGVLNYLQLALTLFFLPFFTSFGTPLLKVITSLMGTLTDATTKLSSYFQESDNTANQILDEAQLKISELLTTLEESMPSLVEGMSELVEPMLEFISKFATVIISNYDDILDLVSTGIRAFNDMLSQGLLAKFIHFGSLIFEFISENAGSLQTLFSVALDLVVYALNFAQVVLQDLENFTMAILASIGSIAGAIGGFQAGLAAAWFTFGLSIPAATAAGAVAGAGIGAASALAIVLKFIKPVKREMISAQELKVSKYAEGGKIYGRRGGKLGLFAEAGEGEYIIPESKLKLFRGNNNVVIRFKGKVYNKREIDKSIQEVIRRLPEGYSLD